MKICWYFVLTMMQSIPVHLWTLLHKTAATHEYTAFLGTASVQMAVSPTESFRLKLRLSICFVSTRSKVRSQPYQRRFLPLRPKFSAVRLFWKFQYLHDLSVAILFLSFSNFDYKKRHHFQDVASFLQKTMQTFLNGRGETRSCHFFWNLSWISSTFRGSSSRISLILIRVMWRWKYFRGTSEFLKIRVQIHFKFAENALQLEICKKKYFGEAAAEQASSAHRLRHGLHQALTLLPLRTQKSQALPSGAGGWRF